MAALCLVQMFYVCELGEQVDVIIVIHLAGVSEMLFHNFLLHSMNDKDNGLADTFYNSKWYILPINIQMDVRHLIHRNQHGEKLIYGPFGTINRAYFTMVFTSRHHLDD